MRTLLGPSLATILLASVVACASEAPAPAQPPPAAPPDRSVAQLLIDEYDQDMVIDDATTGGCEIKSKSATNLRVKAGSWVYWSVKNDCRRKVKLKVKVLRPKAGNKSGAPNPFSTVFGDELEPGEIGYVTWKVKSKKQLDPQGTISGPDGWEFVWRVNNRDTNDPELEVEY
jgi:hypothetical protein